MLMIFVVLGKSFVGQNRVSLVKLFRLQPSVTTHPS